MAAYEVNTLCRILEVLTVRSLTPESLYVRRDADMQSVIIDLVDISDHDAVVIQNKMRQIVTVQSVVSEMLVPLNTPSNISFAA